MANKDAKSVIVEYVSSLSNDQLQFLTSRLVEKLGGDLAEALDEMAKDKKIDDILSDAGSSENLYNVLDSIRDVCLKEFKKRDIPATAAV
jgi:hypothetical protein